MIKIGDFSSLSRVSVKTLRYYDEMGLLKPVRVDEFTGYRYYAFDQLPRLNRILALKDLGFALEHIARMLDEGLPPDELRGMLRLRQAELRQQLEADQERLARVEARLRQIEQENKMPRYDVLIRQLEPQTVAALREVIPTPQDVGRLFERLLAHLGRRGVRPAGPVGALWHDIEYHDRNLDTEVVVPIAQALPADDGIQAVELPGVASMARAIHRGSYDGFAQAYAAIMQWIESNGYRVAGPIREIYLRGPGPEPTDPANYLTEIQVPVEKA